MKIAMIGQKGMPMKYGGVERHVHELSVRLAKNNHDVTVYTRPYYTDNKLKQFEGVRLVSIPSLHKKNLDAITHVFLCTVHALFQKYDVIHYHGVGPSLMAWIPRVFKPKTKIIVTFHAQDKLQMKWSSFAKKMLALGEWTATHFPHATIVISKQLLGYLSQKYPKKNIIYIPNGIDPKNTASEDEMIAVIKQFGLEKNKYFLSVCRFIPDKGIHYLCKTWNAIKTDFQLVIVGDLEKNNKYVEYLLDLSKNNPKIKFVGFQTGKTLETLYRMCYVYAHPSKQEGMPFTILEAMGYEKCVLASDIPQLQEAIQDSGFTFKSQNVNDLKDKILYLISHPEIVEQTARKGKERVIKNYHWDHVIERIQKVYSGL